MFDTIKEHLDKELVLRPQGIKVLSLFFIDDVSKYRQYDADGRAMISLVNMLIGTATGLMVWSFCNSFLWKRPFTDNTAAGTLAAFSAITPVAGYLLLQSAMILACVSVVISNILFHATSRKASHDPQRQLFYTLGIGSLNGLLGAGMFATTAVAGYRWDGRAILGLIQGNSNQILMQGIAMAAVIAWSTIMSWLLFKFFLPRQTTA